MGATANGMGRESGAGLILLVLVLASGAWFLSRGSTAPDSSTLGAPSAVKPDATAAAEEPPEDLPVEEEAMVNVEPTTIALEEESEGAVDEAPLKVDRAREEVLVGERTLSVVAREGTTLEPIEDHGLSLIHI